MSKADYGYCVERMGAQWIMSETAPVRFFNVGPFVFASVPGRVAHLATAVLPGRYMRAVAETGDHVNGVRYE
jgi:hypothetical protein